MMKTIRPERRPLPASQAQVLGQSRNRSRIALRSLVEPSHSHTGADEVRLVRCKLARARHNVNARVSRPSLTTATPPQQELGPLSSRRVSAHVRSVSAAPFEFVPEEVSGYDDGIVWDLIDPDSIGISPPIASYTVQTRLGRVGPGEFAAVEVDEVDLELFDV